MDYLCDRTLLSIIYPTRAQMLLNKCHEFKKYTQLATLFEFKSSLCCIAGIIFHTFSFSKPAFKENCSISFHSTLAEICRVLHQKNAKEMYFLYWAACTETAFPTWPCLLCHGEIQNLFIYLFIFRLPDHLTFAKEKQQLASIFWEWVGMVGWCQ